jgi:phage tail-like protein
MNATPAPTAVESFTIYLNRDARWNGFACSGLELGADGTLRLEALPRLEGTPPPGLADLPRPQKPAGIAVGPHGEVYLSDPAAHRLMFVDACNGKQRPVPCLGGEGDAATQLNQPRGLVVHPTRRALIVADSGNRRLQLFDLTSLQLLDIWEGWAADDRPRDVNTPPDEQPPRVAEPWALAADAAGSVYLVDYGVRQVHRFDTRGAVDPAFWENLRAALSGIPFAPSDIAVDARGATDQIFILDSVARTIYTVDPDGSCLRQWATDLPSRAMGMAVWGDSLYVGDNTHGRLWRFRAGRLIGEAHLFEGPVAGLTFTPNGDLLVHSGTFPTPILVRREGAHRRRGLLCGGPFRNPSSVCQWLYEPPSAIEGDGPSAWTDKDSRAVSGEERKPRSCEQWHRLRLTVEPLAPESRLDLHIHQRCVKPKSPRGPRPQREEAPPPSPPPPLVYEDSADPFADTAWQAVAVAPGATETVFLGAPGDEVWVGVEFFGDGRSSPALSQARLDFNHPTYLTHLPAVYWERTRERHFLARFLSLFEGLFEDLETRIAQLPDRFDPVAAPVTGLPWLAGWLGHELDDCWDEARRRQEIAAAFDRFGLRGTVAGLRQAVRDMAGVEVVIEEPLLQSDWWGLPGEEELPAGVFPSVLGVNTVLIAAEPQGAVLGTTAVLDQSHLLSEDDFGAVLFDELAHRFTVRLYRGRTYSERVVDEVRAVLDREKPAHTAYDLCLVEPRMRVGFQARVGIDSIVAAPPSPTVLSPPAWAEPALVLGGDSPGRIGDADGIGRSTRLDGNVTD